MTFRICFLCGLVSLCLCCVACPVDGFLDTADTKRVTVMTYNTQAFFDATDDGIEFEEYTGAESKWTEEMYLDRLDRLRDTILLCGLRAGCGPDRGPDIVVLQEIENKAVVEDICNRIPQRGYYEHAVFVPPEKGSSFGTAILSRFPIESFSAHSLGSVEVALRPLLEVCFKIDSQSLVVYAVHWKSKSGDVDTTPIRLLQEAQLFERIALLEESNPDIPFIACGDFNQKRDEFTVMNKYQNCWDWWLPLRASGEVTGVDGSYYYDSTWETIDNIFYSSSLCDGAGFDFHSFQVVSTSPLVTSSSIPARFNVYTGKGYSDHLPLCIEIKKVNK